MILNNTNAYNAYQNAGRGPFSYTQQPTLNGKDTPIGTPSSSTTPSIPTQANNVGASITKASGNKIVPATDREDVLREQFDEKVLKKMGIVPCETCAARKYQDGSNDPGVSFKSPQHISPEQSGSVVMSHEMEHVTREQADAESEDREVISQSVQLFTGVCPECGKSYVSGGVTKTTTAAKSNSDTAEQFLGNLLDMKL